MRQEPTLSILLADDEEIVLQTIGDYLKDLGHQVMPAHDGDAAVKLLEAQDFDLGLIDIRMPGLDGMAVLEKGREIQPEVPFVIITGYGDMEKVKQSLRLGAADFLLKPIKLLELEAVVEKSRQIHTLRQERRLLRETVRSLQKLDSLRAENRTIVGQSPATQAIRELVQQAVKSGCDNILITGETGTGKEIVARAIHFQASSEAGPFIAVSCPALPDSLVESEMFGHRKGAFTGAIEDKAGYFELANNGTLFLDEIGDLSPSAQAALLRILETRTFRRIGGSKEIQVNVRVIAATNAPLQEFMAAGKFRRDLFYRLNPYSIHLLPLRNRQEDILPLANHFLVTYARARSLRLNGFSEEAKERLLGYDYPGNARELRNLVECAAILCRSGEIQARHINLPQPYGTANSNETFPASSDEERSQILKVLEETKWNRRLAAQKLNLPYSTLRWKMMKMGIK